MSGVAPQALNGSVTYNFLATTLKKWTLCKIQFFFPKINTCMSRFQDQLDEYEAERNALLSQNSQAKDEVITLKLWSFMIEREHTHLHAIYFSVEQENDKDDTQWLWIVLAPWHWMPYTSSRDLLLCRARKWQRRHTMIVHRFGRLALDAYFFFFSTKAQRCIDRSRHHHFLTRPNSLSVSTPGGTPIWKRWGCSSSRLGV